MTAKGLSSRAVAQAVNLFERKTRLSVGLDIIHTLRKSNDLNHCCRFLTVSGSQCRQLHSSTPRCQHPKLHQSSHWHPHTRHQNHRHIRSSSTLASPSLNTPGATTGRLCRTTLSPCQPRANFTSSSHPNNDNDSPTIVEPHKMVAEEMKELAPSICNVLNVDIAKMRFMAQYYFDGKGKAFRPMVGLLMAKACNAHSGKGESIMESQKTVAMVSEMVHTASLVHDDVIDAADTRRGQRSLNYMFGQRQAIMTGDYILSQATIALAKTGNPRVISLLAQVLEDLVRGEFMQLGSKEDESERFQHYLKKTYKKTASLIANTCKSMSVLAEVDEDVEELAFQYGRNLGIAFQLVDDLLDFVSSQQVMGKPTAADLKLGLATAPVLFAALQHKELQPMIMRRFSEDGDVEYARAIVDKSDGVEQTKLLATQHSTEAVRILSQLSPSPARQALERLAKILLERKN